ncbi:MAG: prepilin-type N-terminal cleavage/methylation domain-containing protein [Candidatus Omnitrophota bacterium]
MYSKKTGFTLIELITALSIFAIGVLSLISLLTVGLGSFGRSSDTTVATLKAQEKLEEIKRNGFNSASLPSAPALPARGDFSVAVQFPAPADRFSWQVAVSYVDDGTGTTTAVAGLKEVVVRINWSRFGRQYNEDFTTYISQH